MMFANKLGIGTCSPFVRSIESTQQPLLLRHDPPPLRVDMDVIHRFSYGLVYVSLVMIIRAEGAVVEGCTCTGVAKRVLPRFGEFCYCCCLPLLPQLA